MSRTPSEPVPEKRTSQNGALPPKVADEVGHKRVSIFTPFFNRFLDPKYNARILWIILTLVIVGMIAAGSRRCVTHSYREAAQLWLIGADLYDGQGTGFLYLPQAALLFVPAALLPETAGRLAWRLISLVLLASGLQRMTRAVPGSSTSTKLSLGFDRASYLYWFASVITVPLFFSSLRNGQSTVLMAGAMLHGIAELQQARWNRSALWLMLALAVKPLALPLILLAGAMHAPLRWRAALAIVGCFAFPFLCQHPEYVVRQYQACFKQMAIATEKGQEAFWAEPFSSLELLGVMIPKPARTAIRGLAALGCLALCLVAVRRHNKTSAHWQLTGWSACYILLMNPRSENSTYGLLGPILGLYFAKAIEQRRASVAMVLAMLSGLILGSFEVARLFSPRDQSIWLAPLATLGFVVFLARELGDQQNHVAELPLDDSAIGVGADALDSSSLRSPGTVREPFSSESRETSATHPGQANHRRAA